MDKIFNIIANSLSSNYYKLKRETTNTMLAIGNYNFEDKTENYPKMIDYDNTEYYVLGFFTLLKEGEIILKVKNTYTNEVNSLKPWYYDNLSTYIDIINNINDIEFPEEN